ncbi:MAG: DUF1364 family protein [Cycloclasticus sp.]
MPLKNKNYRNPKITRFAKLKMCTLLIPGICNGDPTTSVWAHSNLGRHGKGKGIKAHDFFGAIACSDCHDAVDGRRNDLTQEDRVIYLNQGISRTLPMLFDAGVIA